MREEVATFGTNGSLYGVVSLPPSGVPAEWGALLLNAGLLHRVGPHRWYVQVARALAGLGFAALRFDRSGIGDSPARTSGDRFERAAVEEVGQAMRWLSDQHGCRRFALLGMCTGAEVAFKTACQDPRVGAMVLINAPRYLGEPDLEFLTRIKSRFKARRRWRLTLASPNWRRLIIGQHSGALVRALGRSVGRAALGRPSGAPAADVAHIRGMLDRDVRFLVLLSEADWTREYAHAIFASATDGRKGSPSDSQRMVEVNPRLEVIRGADHTFTALATRDMALDLITGWARALVARDPDPAGRHAEIT